MSEADIIRNCAPTLAGMKTGSAFVCRYESEALLRDHIRCLNLKLCPRGVRSIPLRMRNCRALIYVFRPKALDYDLSQQDARAILVSLGYCINGMNGCVAQLAGRIRNGGDFPHEIGLFLGYPPEDVIGFMENHGHGYKQVGCWKVYGDEDATLKRFEQYKTCSRIYRSFWEKGFSLEGLTVSI